MGKGLTRGFGEKERGGLWSLEGTLQFSALASRLIVLLVGPNISFQKKKHELGRKNKKQIALDGTHRFVDTRFASEQSVL